MPFAISLRDEAAKEYAWAQRHEPAHAEKIDDLLAAIRQDPFKGIGKPEPLKYGLHGFWSRHISKKHRLVYEVVGHEVLVHHCYEHYEDH